MNESGWKNPFVSLSNGSDTRTQVRTVERGLLNECRSVKLHRSNAIEPMELANRLYCWSDMCPYDLPRYRCEKKKIQFTTKKNTEKRMIQNIEPFRETFTRLLYIIARAGVIYWINFLGDAAAVGFYDDRREITSLSRRGRVLSTGVFPNAKRNKKVSH